MRIDRIRFGDEVDERLNGAALYLAPVRLAVCPDCGAPLGQYHTPGCDIEQCPKCKRQLIGCPHAKKLLPEHRRESEDDD
jgi:hypothetical protein